MSQSFMRIGGEWNGMVREGPGVAIGSAVAGLAGGAIQANSAERAADAQVASANRAADLAQARFEQTRTDLAPWRSAGSAALERLSQIFGLSPGSTPALSSSGQASGTAASGTSAGPSTPFPQNSLFSRNGLTDDQLMQIVNTQGQGLLPNGYYVHEDDGGLVRLTNPYGEDAGIYRDLSAALRTVGLAGGTPATPPPTGGSPPASTWSGPGGALAPYGLSSLTFQPTTAVFNPTQQTLEATPGYQFTRDQGLRAVQSSNAAKGLGVSGAALRGAARFATGLADNTLQTQQGIFQANLGNQQSIFQQNYHNVLDPLFQISGAGQNASAQTGALGQQAASTAGQALIGAGNAAAAGQVGAATAISGGLNSAARAGQDYLLYQTLADRQRA